MVVPSENTLLFGWPSGERAPGEFHIISSSALLVGSSPGIFQEPGDEAEAGPGLVVDPELGLDVEPGDELDMVSRYLSDQKVSSLGALMGGVLGAEEPTDGPTLEPSGITVGMGSRVGADV